MRTERWGAEKSVLFLVLPAIGGFYYYNKVAWKLYTTNMYILFTMPGWTGIKAGLDRVGNFVKLFFVLNE